MTLLLRAGGSGDTETLVGLFDEAVEWLVARDQPDQWGAEPWSTQPQAVERVEALADDELWIAELAGTPVGGLVVGEHPPYVDPPSEPELYVILVLTSRRYEGRGFGSNLLQQAEQLAVARGAQQLRVDCWARAPGLIAWYERHGFHRQSSFDVGGWPGQVLRKSLAPG